MNGTVPAPLPSGVEAMAAGAALLGVLESVDPGLLSGSDTVDYAAAVYRLVNHVQGLLLAAVAETGVAEKPLTTDRVAHPDVDFGADEIRAALVLTRTAAEGWLWLAWDLRTRLPQVQAALLSGVLDLPRAKILSEWTLDLPDPAARALVEHLLGRAHLVTTGQLIDESKRLAVAIDPQWARRRYERGLTGRKVVARRNPDGTANLGGYDLPVERVAAAAARVDRLAKAARRAGHPDVLDHLRADLYLSLLDGAYEALTDEQILEDLIARGEQKKAQAAAADAAEADAAADEPGADTEPADPATPAPTSPRPTSPRPAAPTGRGIEVRARLSTLLGLDAFPGELAGWGAIHAELARRLVTDNTGGQWRFVITDEDGYPIHTGLLRARPAASMRHGAGVVEIQIHASLLDSSPQHPTWDPVIAELRQHLHDITTREGDRDKRVPGPALRRFLHARNRTCVFPGCRMPAGHTDIDHTREHGHGGETVEDNLAPLCRHDHRARHDAAWRISQPEPGYITWTSPLGHAYDVKPKPVIPPLPDPVPPSGKDPHDRTTPDGPWNEHILVPEPAEQPQAPRPPPPATVDDDDDEPPF
jgi:hypothetical protein